MGLSWKAERDMQADYGIVFKIHIWSSCRLEFHLFHSSKIHVFSDAELHSDWWDQRILQVYRNNLARCQARCGDQSDQLGKQTDSVQLAAGLSDNSVGPLLAELGALTCSSSFLYLEFREPHAFLGGWAMYEARASLHCVPQTPLHAIVILNRVGNS
jgi:hypothetical protein